MPIEGGGGRPPVGPILGITPSSLAFGDVVDGQTTDLTLTFTNFDSVNSISVNLPTIDNARFTFTGIIGLLTAGQSKNITVTFAPTATGAQSGVLTATNSGINTPVTANLTGTGVAAGTKSLGVDPSSSDFGDQKIAIPTSEKLFTITNTGDVDVQISGITFTAPFSAGGTAPATPFTLTSGSTETFGVIFTPVAAGLITKSNGAIVASDASSSPFNVETAGTGFLIAPVFTVTGADGGLLLGFVTGSTVVVKRADPADLDCEEAGSFRRVHDFGLPGKEKAIQRVRFRYEDLGVATVNVQLRAIRPTTQSVSQNVVIGTAGAGEDIKNAFADLVMAHDLIEVQFSRLANGGPVSITEYDPRVEERGEVIAAT